MFLEISQNSQENTCTRYLCSFPVNFLYFPFFTEHLQTTASEIRRVTFFRIFFFFGQIYFTLLQMFNIEILIGADLQKNISWFFQ